MHFCSRMRKLLHNSVSHCGQTRCISTAQYQLEGRAAVVTGGSRGIGLAIAQRFAQEGIGCLLVGREKATLEDAAQKVRRASESRGDADVSYLVADITSPDAWHVMDQSKTRKSSSDVDGAASWLERHPNPDILVNAAGVSQNSLLFCTEPAMLHSTVQTNLEGPMLACREIGKQMVKARKSHSGCIINISSLLAWQGGRGSAAYSASKAGLLGLTRALAAEMGPLNVRVNAIVPGYVETDMISGMTSGAKDALLKKIPLGRFARPEEVAEAAVFLVGCEYANNCVLNLDGGLSAYF